jgi:sensor histidine kinase YesM
MVKTTFINFDESLRGNYMSEKIAIASTIQMGGRKNFLINPKFQLSFLAYTAGIAVVTIGFFYAADAYFFWKFTQLGQGLGLPSNHVFFQFLDEQRSAKNLYYGVAAAIGLAAIAGWSLVLSHRVAGPLYRLRKHASAVASGETVSDVRFRRGDFFPEVAEAYNLQMKRYRDVVQAAGGKLPIAQDIDDSNAA